MNVAVLLDLIAAAAPTRPLLGTTTTGQLREAVARDAAALRAHRAAGAERVAYLGTMGPRFVRALLASCWAGLTFAPLNYRLRSDELDRLLERLAPLVLLTDEELLGKVPLSWHAHRASLAPKGPSLEEPEASPPATALLLFTSGTSAQPKAAALRHDNLFAYVTSTADLASAGEAECALVSVPPYHIAGVANTLSNLYAGRRVVHLANFDPERWLEIVTEEHVTHALVVPTMLVRILDALERRADLRPVTLRTLSYGGGPIAQQTIERALTLLPPTVGLVNAYGLTESTSSITVLTPADHRRAWTSNDPAVRARLGSIGRPLPGVRIRVAAADGSTAPPRVTGEILVSGPQVSGRYEGHAASIDEEGWLHTGDLAYADEEGYLFLVGRADDMIIRGGENISPVEVEDVLREHPAVADAAVVGVADEQWGQRVMAAVALRDGAEYQESDVIEHVRSRLGSHKCPERLVVLPQIPYSDTGKVLRRTLRVPLLAALRTPA